MSEGKLERIFNLVEHSIDIHVHPMPDIIKRGFSDEEYGWVAQALKMDGVVVKNHYWPTQNQLDSINAKLKKPLLYGSITLNHYVGGINPYALEVAIALGAKVVWLPTRHAQNHMDHTVPGKILFNPPFPLMEAKGIRVIDEKGKLIPAMRDIFDLCAKHEICLMTSHISNEEAYAVCIEAIKSGVKRIVLSHPDFSVNMTPLDMQIDLAKRGVYIEKTMFGILSGVRSVEEMLDSIRKIGSRQCIFSTDYGAPVIPNPWNGMLQCVELLFENGFSEDEIHNLISDNPHFLLNLPMDN